MRGEERLELVLRLVAEPVADDRAGQPAVRAGLDDFQKTVAPVRRLFGHRVAEDFDGVGLPVFHQLADEPARLLADSLVVGADEKGIAVPVDGAVQHNHGNLPVNLLDHGGQPVRLVGGDNQKVDSLRHQVFHVVNLLFAALLRVGENDAHVGVFCGLRLDFPVHGHAPRLHQVCLGHPDQIFYAAVLFPGVEIPERAGGNGRQQEKERGEQPAPPFRLHPPLPLALRYSAGETPFTFLNAVLK